MKTVLKGTEPSLLLTYRTDNPNNSWKQFRSSDSRKSAVRSQLIADQGGLCVYCEINLRIETIAETSDFRVEHFHPKSDDTRSHNWNLDWQNLFGCCHGGSSKLVVDDRFTEDNSLHSCDVPKGEFDWDAVILNPLELPTTVCLFRFNRNDGSMYVLEKCCLESGVEPQRAESSIEKLRLNSKRLRTLRKSILNNLNDRLQMMCNTGMALKEAKEKLAKMILIKNSEGHWPAFFSAIRNYLGKEAESHLTEIGYDG